MANQLAIIEQKINSKPVTNDLMLALDLEPGNEKDIREAAKYTNSVLMEIKRTQGSGGYTDLTLANPDSIVRSMIDAAKFKLQIDGRKLCYLEKRGDVVSLQINANGFVAKIKESYPDATFVVTPVFNGDPAPKIQQSADGNKTCEFTSTNVFGDPKDLKGILVCISYTDHGGKHVSDVEAVPIADLQKMQAQSKSKAWGTYTIERMKTAALKRATKWHFRKNSTLQALIDYDNSENYDLNAPATPVRKTIVDNINESVAHRPTPENTPAADANTHQPEKEAPGAHDNVQDADFIDVVDDTPPHDSAEYDALVADGDKAAAQGWPIYKAWATGLTDAQRDLIRSRHEDWKNESQAITTQHRAAQDQQNNQPPMDDTPPHDSMPMDDYDPDAPPM